MNETGIKRIFVAAEPPAEIRKRLVSTIMDYKKEPWAPQVKWVRTENLHLTLKFAGNMEQILIDETIQYLSETLIKTNPFPVSINALKILPKPSRPSVISAGIEDAPLLSELARSIETLFEKAGVAKEKRKFNGHITLGRFRKKFSGSPLIQDLIPRATFMIDSVVLFQSILRPTGPEYFVEKEIRLGDTGQSH